MGQYFTLKMKYISPLNNHPFSYPPSLKGEVKLQYKVINPCLSVFWGTILKLLIKKNM